MKRSGNGYTTPENFTATLTDILQNYFEEGEKAFFDAIDEAADKCNETVKQYLWKGHGIKRGRYIKKFRVQKEQIGLHRRKATWYVDAPEYRLTHLLENGHLTRGGTSRTKEIKHIEHGQEIAEQVIDERATRGWES